MLEHIVQLCELTYNLTSQDLLSAPKLGPVERL